VGGGLAFATGQRGHNIEPRHYQHAAAGRLTGRRVRRLRRGLRDVRDWMGCRRRVWRPVCFAGLMGGDHTAMVVISHEGVGRHEVLGVLRRRWPHVVVKELEHEEPTWAMTADGAAERGRCRRGWSRCGSWLAAVGPAYLCRASACDRTHASSCMTPDHYLYSAISWACRPLPS
jgi:hypothetical protein